ncbi:MAG: hypothetical protein ACTS73_09820 [Arsenophonus sp. NEOnobi-MAG3]
MIDMDHLSNEILEDFNTECVNRFLELIIDKASILCSNRGKCYETFAIEHEITHQSLIRLNN